MTFRIIREARPSLKLDMKMNNTNKLRPQQTSKMNILGIRFLSGSLDFFSYTFSYGNFYPVGGLYEEIQFKFLFEHPALSAKYSVYQKFRTIHDNNGVSCYCIVSLL